MRIKFLAFPIFGLLKTCMPMPVPLVMVRMRIKFLMSPIVLLAFLVTPVPFMVARMMMELLAFPNIVGLPVACLVMLLTFVLVRGRWDFLEPSIVGPPTAIKGAYMMFKMVRMRMELLVLAIVGLPISSASVHMVPVFLRRGRRLGFRPAVSEEVHDGTSKVPPVPGLLKPVRRLRSLLVRPLSCTCLEGLIPQGMGRKAK
ncbi:unnamed protein product [Prorocentrum cordatum]|uniref:Uncharacterized protein n=1 Tax=Prorocentrum cordatum TaxID=2364126 RepID=A0ABN9S5L5_9DINO|nr:unnamed protein product [Polarella glacialis]